MSPLRSLRRALALASLLALAACSPDGGATTAHPTVTTPTTIVAGGGAPRPSTPAPHGSHDAAHGGFVLMDAVHHVELVLDVEAGRHRLHVSDAARAPLPASTFDTVELTIGDERLVMTRTADDAAWQAAGAPAPRRRTDGPVLRDADVRRAVVTIPRQRLRRAVARARARFGAGAGVGAGDGATASSGPGHSARSLHAPHSPPVQIRSYSAWT